MDLHVLLCVWCRCYPDGSTQYGPMVLIKKENVKRILDQVDQEIKFTKEETILMEIKSESSKANMALARFSTKESKIAPLTALFIPTSVSLLISVAISPVPVANVNSKPVLTVTAQIINLTVNRAIAFAPLVNAPTATSVTPVPRGTIPTCT